MILGRMKPVALDSTMFESGHVSRHFEKRQKQTACQNRRKTARNQANSRRRAVHKRLPKLSLAVTSAFHLILAARVTTGSGGDKPFFKPLLREGPPAGEIPKGGGRFRLRLGGEPSPGPAGLGRAVDHSPERGAADSQARLYPFSAFDATALCTQGGPEMLRSALAGGNRQLDAGTQPGFSLAGSYCPVQIEGTALESHHPQSHDSDRRLRIETEQECPPFSRAELSAAPEPAVEPPKGGAGVQPLEQQDQRTL